jgi:Ni/Co efflux regulator RcnB
VRYRKIQLKTLGIILALTFCTTGGLAVHADSNKGDKEHGNQYKKNKHSDSKKDKQSRRTISIEKNDRETIRHYMQGHSHRTSCPPGLAKKHNGCMPPGQARKYEIGKKLPEDVTYEFLPYALRRNLQPLQSGYQYVLVDNDVLLMSKTDRTIADIVTLMSDLSQ